MTLALKCLLTLLFFQFSCSVPQYFQPSGRSPNYPPLEAPCEISPPHHSEATCKIPSPPAHYPPGSPHPPPYYPTPDPSPFPPHSPPIHDPSCQIPPPHYPSPYHPPGPYHSPPSPHTPPYYPTPDPSCEIPPPPYHPVTPDPHHSPPPPHTPHYYPTPDSSCEIPPPHFYPNPPNSYSDVIPVHPPADEPDEPLPPPPHIAPFHPPPPHPPQYPPPAVHPRDNVEKFPHSFSFGVGNGAYHIEGAWNEDRKGENIWDRWLHVNPGIVVDGTNGDFSSDAYNHIKEDVEIFNNLSINHYRFSISWARILPEGCGEINQLGIDHYKRLLHLLKINQIEPFVTMYHGDLPQALQDQGGFLCESFVDWFVEYAAILFEYFGDDVQYWITFNDPTSVCKGGYGDGTYAPGYIESPPYLQYLCGHNLLKAHAAVYHMYDSYYRPTQKGKISFAISTDWYEPTTDCDTDVLASETKLQFQIGWWAHPIYRGDYPPIMKERIALRSESECLSQSRLPVFTQQEIEWIKDTHDFFSITYKTFVVYVQYNENCYDDIGIDIVSYEEDNAFGIRKLLNWIQQNYYNPSIFIANSGYGSESRDLVDDDRISYMQSILRNIRTAQVEDDARVYGYTYYSYIDGFQWLNGYTLKFGLYDVDYDCPAKTRTARKSASYFQDLCRTGVI